MFEKISNFHFFMLGGICIRINFFVCLLNLWTISAQWAKGQMDGRIESSLNKTMLTKAFIFRLGKYSNKGKNPWGANKCAGVTDVRTVFNDRRMRL